MPVTVLQYTVEARGWKKRAAESKKDLTYMCFMYINT